MKKRVLLVEDNVPTIDLLVIELKHLGYEVSVATNGREGVAMALTQLPDLIIMDMQMPKMDGFQATAQIRENPATRNIPILAATAKAMSGDKEQCLRAGCDGYIAKPFDHEELEAAIASIPSSR